MADYPLTNSSVDARLLGRASYLRVFTLRSFSCLVFITIALFISLPSVMDIHRLATPPSSQDNSDKVGYGEIHQHQSRPDVSALLIWDGGFSSRFAS